MKLVLILSAGVILACNSRKAEQKDGSLTSQSVKVKNIVDTKDDFESPDLKKVRKEYINSYRKTMVIDTSFVNHEETYRIVFKHYCTFDSSIVVPATYNFDTNGSFTTHNFQ